MTIKDRSIFIDIAKKYKTNCRCLIFNTNKNLCLHNSYFRNFTSNGNIKAIPKIVYDVMNKKYEKPTINEGFNEIIEINFNLDTNNKELYNLYYY